MAKVAIDAYVREYHTQQQQYRAEGKSNALNIEAAGQAAANLSSGMPELLKQNYSQAASQLQGIAGGYTGDLRKTAEADAARVKAQVEGIGGNYNPVGSNGVNIDQLGAAAGNAMYGTQGAIPASGLVQSGISEFNLATALPGIIRGAGLQSGLLAEAAGNKKADALFKNIANVRATMPSVTSSYLSKLNSDDVRKATLLMAAQKAGLASGGIDTGLSNFTGVLYGKDGQPKKDASGNLITKYGTHLDPHTGRVVPDQKAANGLTASTIAGMWPKINKMVSDSVQGVYTNPTISQGQAYQFQTSPALSANEAWTKALYTYPQLFKSLPNRNLLLHKIEQAYGKSFSIGKDGQLTSYVGLLGDAPSGPGAPVVRVPLD